MEIKLRQLIELANEILNVNNRAQKKRGLKKIISKLEEDYSEPIKAAKDELDKFKDLKFDYLGSADIWTKLSLISIGCGLEERDLTFMDNETFNHKDYQGYKNDIFFALGLKLHKLTGNKSLEDYYIAVLLWIILQNELRFVWDVIDVTGGAIKSSKFSDIIQYPNKDELLKRLHELIDGKGGAEVGAVLLNAWLINSYLTRRPTKAEFESEFELIGSWQAISNYMNDNSEKALEKANRIVIFW